MAGVDPYAERSGIEPVIEITGPPPWAPLVSECGGTMLGEEETLPGELRESRFIAVGWPGAGVVPPLARLSPEQAAMLAVAGDPSGTDGGRLLHDLKETGAPLLLLKHGWVAGPPGADGVTEVDLELMTAVLNAALNPDTAWERDPDFGWQLLVSAPGLDPEGAEVLRPRLRYAARGRAYEHAELVPQRKQAWHRALSRRSDLPAELIAATGWPVEPTASAWRE